MSNAGDAKNDRVMVQKKKAIRNDDIVRLPYEPTILKKGVSHKMRVMYANAPQGDGYTNECHRDGGCV